MEDGNKRKPRNEEVLNYVKCIILPTNSKVMIGLALLGISGGFLALTGYYVLRASSGFVDGLYPYGLYPGCDSCSKAIELIFDEAKILGIIGGIVGSIGVWFVIMGYKQEKVASNTPKSQ